MLNYEWVLFDVDETLVHFDDFRGLQIVLAQLQKEFTIEDYNAYFELNQALWKKYEQGTINIQALQNQRFCPWAEKLQIPLEVFKETFHQTMVETCTLIDGAFNLISFLKDKVNLGLITNGFTRMQQQRLQRIGILEQFKLLIISEEVGVGKPHPQIFNHALSLMGKVSPTQILMVGDNIEADIGGGLNAGFHTCWINARKKIAPFHIKPHFEVHSLLELKNMLVNANNLQPLHRMEVLSP